MTNSIEPDVIVYTTPTCQQCRMVKRFLSDKSISYREVDLSVSEEALARVKAHGFNQAPVLEATDHSRVSTPLWSGFNPGIMQQLIA